MQIESLNEWADISSKLLSHGYRLWQWQYSSADPEGFHAVFYVPGKADIEIITHSHAVEEAILLYLKNQK